MSSNDIDNRKRVTQPGYIAVPTGLPDPTHKAGYWDGLRDIDGWPLVWFSSNETPGDEWRVAVAESAMVEATEQEIAGSGVGPAVKKQ